mmetsp:Transcript_16534/g.46982  ORF Transcript_16534/g.46982 Transcript_16534/m.46982 type:complete len:198 (-) Transcript_16534:367-960(-)
MSVSAQDDDDGEEDEGAEDHEHGDSVVDATTCAREDDWPRAFCDKVEPSFGLWSAAWASILGSLVAEVRCPCVCHSGAPRARASMLLAITAWVAMVASIATLASARSDLAAELAAAGPDGHTVEVEVQFGWAFYVAVACVALQLLGVACGLRSCRKRGGDDVPEPVNLKGNADAGDASVFVVVGQPVDNTETRAGKA